MSTLLFLKDMIVFFFTGGDEGHARHRYRR